MGLAADFVLVVVAGLLGGLLARAARLPLLVGYVVAGIFVGPYTGGPTVVQIRDVETLAEIGVALLLFSLGLEVSFRDLSPVRRVALIGGPIQIAATIMTGAAAAVYGLDAPLTDGLWFGAMISVSSTMVVLKILGAAGLITSLSSRVMIGLLLVQDLAVIPMLIILPELGGPEGLATRVSGSILVATGVLGATFLAGTRLLPPLLRWILSFGSRELFLVAVVATAVGTGAAMHAAGFSFALGAFVGGLILSESEFSHQALSDVVPLRDIFGLLFFVTVGMLFDPIYALQNPGLISFVVLAIICGKALIFGVLARAFGYRHAAPWVIGLGLSQIGEFSFVLARTGFSGNFVSKPMYDLVLTATVLTMALSPAVSGAAVPLSRLWLKWAGEKPSPADRTPPAAKLCGHVVVAGYGRTGRAVASALREAGIPLLVVEAVYAHTADVAAHGLQSLWGDIDREEILEAAGIRDARMLVLTMPDPNTVSAAIHRGRRLKPDLIVIARSNKIDTLPQLQALGVSAVQPEFEGGLAMVQRGLMRCGRSDAEIAAIVERLRLEIYSNQ